MEKLKKKGFGIRSENGKEREEKGTPGVVYTNCSILVAL